jgi:hypothetical protein
MTMILINALPPNYNMVTFLANIVSPANLRPNAVRTTVQAMYVNSPALTSHQDGGDCCDNNIAAVKPRTVTQGMAAKASLNHPKS